MNVSLNLGRESGVRIPVFILCLFTIAAFVFRADTLTWERAALSLCIAWVGIVPGLIYLSSHHGERTPFPLMPLVGLFYAIFFGLSGFTAPYLRFNDTGKILVFSYLYIDDISIFAQTLVLSGVILMMACWARSRQVFQSRIPRFSLPVQYPAWRLQVLVWALIGGNLSYIYFPIVRALPSVGQFLQPVGYLGFALMLVLRHRNILPVWQTRAYFFVVVPLWLFGLLATGFLAPIMLIGGLYISVTLFLTGRLAWKQMLAISLAFIVTYPVMTNYRHLIWVPGKSIASLQKLQLIGDAVANYVAMDQKRLSDRSSGLFRRVGLILTLSHVVEETPRSVPYWKGETYRPLFTSWIPRVFWKGKPQEKAGYTFGVRYSFIGKSDTRLSYNLPWITELFANFGLAGVVIGMPLIGLFLSMMEAVFNRPGQSFLEYGVGATILLPLSFQESNFSLMTGSLLPLAVCLWIYFSFGLRFRAPVR